MPQSTQSSESGTEHDGIAWGYRFSKSGTPEIIQGPILKQALESQKHWIWVNVNLSSERSFSALSNLTPLPPLVKDVLTSDDNRQHIERHGEYLSGVAADYDLDTPTNTKRVVQWQFVMTRNLLITAQWQSGYAIDSVHKKLQSGQCFDDVLSLFTGIIHELVSKTRILAHELAASLYDMEEQFLENRGMANPHTLGTVRHRLVQLQRQIFPLRAMIIHLISDPPDWITGEDADDCEKVANRLESLVSDLNFMRERCSDLNEDFHVWEADRTNKRLTVLSVVSSLLLPPTLITGLFGMNVNDLPFHDTPYEFLGAMTVILLSVVPMLIVLRRIKLI